jgi:hypothetical protein
METIVTPDTPLAWHHKLTAKKRTYLGKGWAKRRLLLQVAVLLSAVGPVAGFAQSDNDPLPFYVIREFRISGSVGTTKEYDYREGNQLEGISESLRWRQDRSELIRKVRWSANGKRIERSETPTPLDSIMQESFEIKRRARTDQISAEINVSAAFMTSDDGITIKGLQSITLGPIHDLNYRSDADTSVSFTVMMGAEGTVHICPCDVFASDQFQNQPEFQVDGKNCSGKNMQANSRRGPRTSRHNSSRDSPKIIKQSSLHQLSANHCSSLQNWRLMPMGDPVKTLRVSNWLSLSRSPLVRNMRNVRER